MSILTYFATKNQGNFWNTISTKNRYYQFSRKITISVKLVFRRNLDAETFCKKPRNSPFFIKVASFKISYPDSVKVKNFFLSVWILSFNVTANPLQIFENGRFSQNRLAVGGCLTRAVKPGDLKIIEISNWCFSQIIFLIKPNFL